jgi:hypothetical protein
MSEKMRKFARLKKWLGEVNEKLEPLWAIITFFLIAACVFLILAVGVFLMYFIIPIALGLLLLYFIIRWLIGLIPRREKEEPPENEQPTNNSDGNNPAHWPFGSNESDGYRYSNGPTAGIDYPSSWRGPNNPGGSLDI